MDLPDATAQYKCLEEYHHSTFEDGVSTRVINVERS